MQAWRGHGYGPPESLVWEEAADPPLGEGQVRIEVKAAAVNFPDVLYVAGAYQVKPTPPFVPGFEAAGEVVESRDPALPAGTRVAATLDAGGYATRAVAAGATTYAIPAAMSFEVAAAMTIVYQTGWFALHRRAALKAGEKVLVHAGAGGVGSAAIQLAKAAGAYVIATAGGPDKVAACLALGADAAIDYSSEDFARAVKDRTGGHGVDVIFDPVGGDVFDQSTKCVAFEGRILVVGFASGRIPEVRAGHVLVKNYSVLGLHWGMYNLVDPTAVRRAQEDIYGLWRAGKVKPLVSEARPMTEARAAMRAIISRGTTGKVVLIPGA